MTQPCSRWEAVALLPHGQLGKWGQWGFGVVVTSQASHLRETGRVGREQGQAVPPAPSSPGPSLPSSGPSPPGRQGGSLVLTDSMGMSALWAGEERGSKRRVTCPPPPTTLEEGPKPHVHEPGWHFKSHLATFSMGDGGGRFQNLSEPRFLMS